jgi:hypothetical protein
MQKRMLSVKELNDVLEKLQNNEEISPIGTFSEVDIVFVAGLFLWHKQKHQKLPPIRFNLNENSTRNDYHKHYFLQIKELYDCDYSNWIEFFNKANESGANLYSASFAPILFIDNDNLHDLFENIENGKFQKIRDSYIDKLKESKSNQEEVKYFKQTDNIIQQLKNSTPIHTFIFSVAYHKIQPFVNPKKKGYDSPTIAVQQLWQFTKEYCRGLHELAKNIVEHSGQSESDGQGIITIRAYDPENPDHTDKWNKTKVLETHVFDYGTVGIIPKLKRDTKNKKDNETNTEIQQMYESDLCTLDDKYSLSDFIQSTKKFLYQQFYRDMAHYGLLNFKHLVIDRHKGKIVASSICEVEDKKREYYLANIEIEGDKKREYSIEKGTSYYFEMSFDKEKFRDAEYNTQQQDYSNLSVALGLEKIQDIKFIKDDESDLPEKKENEKYLIEFSIKKSKEKIIKREDEVIVCKYIIEKFRPKFNQNDCYFALNFEGTILDKSNLLRILARLSKENNLPKIIVYNIDFDIFGSLIDDNDKWFNSVKEEWKTPDGQTVKKAYWEKGKSILFFTRYNDFYFADMLYGQSKEEFDKINIIINKTFPNAMVIGGYSKNNDKTTKINISETDCLKPFFYNDALLPFDVILEDDNKQKLFLSNLKKMLENPLILENRKK